MLLEHGQEAVADARIEAQRPRVAGGRGRALGAHPARRLRAAPQPLEPRAGEPEPPLGGLIRVRRGADDDRVGRSDRRTDGPKKPLQVALEGREDLLLDEDALLEGLPTMRPPELAKLSIAQLAGVMGALDDVAMGVAGVAVAAPELTADVGIERPEIHPGPRGGVEDRARAERHELRAAQPLVENRESARHAHRDHPHSRHTRHPDWRSSGAPQSGQGRDAGNPKGEGSGTGKIARMLGEPVVTRIYPEAGSRQGPLLVTIMQCPTSG